MHVHGTVTSRPLLALGGYAKHAGHRGCTAHQHARSTPARRGARTIAISSASDQPRGAPEDQQLEERLEASMAAIDEMMRAITRELFLEAAVADVMEAQKEQGAEGAQATEQQQQQGAEEEDDPNAILRRVVAERIDRLDDSFLATLNMYIAGAEQQGRPEIADLLYLIKEEVLRQIAGRLAPELQVLNAALQAPDSASRRAVLQQYVLMGQEVVAEVVADDGQGARSSALPSCSVDDLQRAVAQVLEDMEASISIPDRRLLARVVLLQEELEEMQQAAEFAGGKPGAGGDSSDSSSGSLGQFRQMEAVPRAVAVFVKELVTVASAEQRRALLRKAFNEDWILGATSDSALGQAATTRADSSPTSTSGGGFAQSLAEQQQQQQQQQLGGDPKEAVRPGRFMQGLGALQVEMLATAASSGDATVSSEVLRRVEDIRREAIAVLVDMAGEGPEYRP